MKFKDRHFAEVYQKQQIEAGYPGRLLPFILEKLDGYKSVIDIGSGTGFFSIPLAERGHLVTAVEPSEKMSGIMLSKYVPGITGRLLLESMGWEEWTGPVHDASVCIHSLYPIRDKKHAVRKMVESSEKRIIIIRNPLVMRTITGLVREELGLSGNPDLNGFLAGTLEEYGIPFTITEIREQRDTVIDDPETEAASIIYRIGAGEEHTDLVASMIRNHAVCKDDRLIFHSVFCDNAYEF